MSDARNGEAQIALPSNEAYEVYCKKKHSEKIQDCQCKSSNSKDLKSTRIVRSSNVSSEFAGLKTAALKTAVNNNTINIQ